MLTFLACRTCGVEDMRFFRQIRRWHAGGRLPPGACFPTGGQHELKLLCCASCHLGVPCFAAQATGERVHSYWIQHLTQSALVKRWGSVHDLLESNRLGFI